MPLGARGSHSPCREPSSARSARLPDLQAAPPSTELRRQVDWIPPRPPPSCGQGPHPLSSVPETGKWDGRRRLAELWWARGKQRAQGHAGGIPRVAAERACSITLQRVLCRAFAPDFPLCFLSFPRRHTALETHSPRPIPPPRDGPRRVKAVECSPRKSAQVFPYFSHASAGSFYRAVVPVRAITPSGPKLSAFMYQIVGKPWALSIPPGPGEKARTERCVCGRSPDTESPEPGAQQKRTDNHSSRLTPGDQRVI